MDRPRAWLLALSLFIGIVAVSCGSLFIRLAAAPSLAVAAYRVFWATVIFAPVVALGPAKEWIPLGAKYWGLLALSGAALALHFALWIASLSFTSVASSVVLVDTTPFFIGLASRWFLGKSPRKEFWIGLAVAFVGCLTIFKEDGPGSGDTMKGNLLAIGGAVAMAVYFLIASRVRPKLSLFAYVWPVYGCAATVLVSACAASGTPLFGFSGSTYLWMFLLGLGPQCVGHTTYNWSLRWLPPGIVALAGLAEPVGASLLAYVFLGEGLTATKLAGGGIILLGIYVATRSAR